MKTDNSLGGPKIKSRFQNDEDSADFGIAKEHLGLVMKYLTEIYDDPVKAAVRETICNALDAMYAAGKTGPVTVTTPGLHNRYFSVTDTGTGMDRRTLMKVYTQYGESTKRTSDDMIGGFGLGCKSPLAIEDEFFIDTTQDGTTIAAKAFKKPDGMFKIDIIDQYESDKTNGTTIRINLKKTATFQLDAAVMDFLEYVPTEKFMLRNADTQDIIPVTYALTDPEHYTLISEQENNVKVYVNHQIQGYNNRAKIVMGDVAYNINLPREFNNNNLSFAAKNVTIVAPINSVDITTSRENVQETKKTHEFLLKTLLKYESDLKTHFQTKIDGATDPQEIYEAVRMAGKLYQADYTYKGETIKTILQLEKMAQKVTKKFGTAPTRSETRAVALNNGKFATFFVLPDDTPATKEGAISRAYNSFLTHKGATDGAFYYLDKDEPKIEDWWATENSSVHFITRADILAGAAEYRKSQRKERPANARPAQKTKYVIVKNDLTIDRAPWGWTEEIEYTEIDKGIGYVTVEDLVHLGVMTSKSDKVINWESELKRFLDVFKYDKPLLVLESTKKEETMLKRLKASKVDFDPAFLVKEYEPDFRKEFQRRAVGTPSIDMRNFVNYLGRDAVLQLEDTRFHKFVETATEAHMDAALYSRLHHVITKAYTAEWYGHEHKARDTWRTIERRWKEHDTFASADMNSRNLLNMYNGYLSLDYRRTDTALVVKIYNLVFNEYL